MSTLSSSLTASTSTSLARALNGAPALAQSLVLSRLASSPTLLPETLASLITAISLAARVSIKGAALFIEALLESARYSTQTSLGLTRRALISAVGSARALHYVNQKLDWSGRNAEGVKSSDAFLQVLDKYTNLGIYMIHHTFTLAELFAMSGFYLTLTTVQTGFSAAEESVKMLDGILGSNETSRALSSIITLVRQELTQDPRFSPAERGAIASLTSLTKALTAFACLQSATHKRTLKAMNLRVVYDCTIISEGRAEVTPDYMNQDQNQSPVKSPTGRKRTETSESIMTDVRGAVESNSRHSLSRPESEDESETEEDIVTELEQLIGSENSSGDEGEELPAEVRAALEGLQAGPEGVRVVRASRFNYEIEVEETTTTTTTTVRTRGATTDSPPRTIARTIRDRTLPHVASLFAEDSSSSDEGETLTRRVALDALKSGATVVEELQEDEWVEVSTIVSSEGREGDDEDTGTARGLPMEFNGRQSVATLSRQDTLDHPEEGRQRLQVVLRTMTKKFTQRKHTIRRVDRSASPDAFSPLRKSVSEDRSPKKGRRADVRNIAWPMSESSSSNDPLSDDPSEPLTRRSKNISHGLSRVLNKAKQSLSRQASGENLPTRSLFANRIRRDTSEDGRSASPPIDRPPLRPSTASLSNQKKPPRPILTTLASPGAIPPPLAPKSSVPPTLRRAASMQSMRSVVTTCTHSAASPAEEPEPKASNYPHDHLVYNLQRFMRYSSAAYGQAFLRILGIGRHDFNFPHTSTHANNHAFAHHCGIKVDDILLSSYTDPSPNFSTAKMSPLVNYVAIDHSISAIVLSCRGSLGLSDLLVDLTCTYEPIPVEHGDPEKSYYVHSGMFNSATTLQRGTVHDTIREALESFPSYGLVLCGHSLGGGVAALLSILWSSPAAAFEEQAQFRELHPSKKLVHPPIATPFVTGFSSGLPPGRPIACFSYGPPCVASPDLVRYCQGLVTSTIHNYDIVSTLSLGVLRDLKSMATGLNSEGGTAEEIVGRVIGLYQRRFLANRNGKKTTQPGATSDSLTEIADEAKEVPLSDLEFEAGKGSNRALDPAYRDPSLIGPELSEDAELNDWLWSLVKTMRAGNDNEKLYPPGTVYLIENYTVFVSGDATTTGGKAKYSRKEGRRIILRAVDNVETRFSEPVFGRTMLSDHSPHNYEICVDSLAQAI